MLHNFTHLEPRSTAQLTQYQLSICFLGHVRGFLRFLRFMNFLYSVNQDFANRRRLESSEVRGKIGDFLERIFPSGSRVRIVPCLRVDSVARSSATANFL
jgi:hypothetical protein